MCIRRIGIDLDNPKCLKFCDFIGFAFSGTIVLMTIVLRYSTDYLTKTNGLAIYDFITIPMRVIILLSVLLGRLLCNATPIHGHHSRSRALCSTGGLLDLLTTVPALGSYILGGLGMLSENTWSAVWSTLLMIDVLRLKRLWRISMYIDNP